MKTFDIFTPEMCPTVRHQSMDNAVNRLVKSMTRLMKEHWPNAKLVINYITKKDVTVHIIRNKKICTGARIVER